MLAAAKKRCCELCEPCFYLADHCDATGVDCDIPRIAGDRPTATVRANKQLDAATVGVTGINAPVGARIAVFMATHDDTSVPTHDSVAWFGGGPAFPATPDDVRVSSGRRVSVWVSEPVTSEITAGQITATASASCDLISSQVVIIAPAETSGSIGGIVEFETQTGNTTASATSLTTAYQAGVVNRLGIGQIATTNQTVTRGTGQTTLNTQNDTPGTSLVGTKDIEDGFGNMSWTWDTAADACCVGIVARTEVPTAVAIAPGQHVITLPDPECGFGDGCDGGCEDAGGTVDLTWQSTEVTLSGPAADCITVDATSETTITITVAGGAACICRPVDVLVQRTYTRTCEFEGSPTAICEEAPNGATDPPSDKPLEPGTYVFTPASFANCKTGGSNEGCTAACLPASHDDCPEGYSLNSTTVLAQVIGPAAIAGCVTIDSINQSTQEITFTIASGCGCMDFTLEFAAIYRYTCDTDALPNPCGYPFCVNCATDARSVDFSICSGNGLPDCVVTDVLKYWIDGELPTEIAIPCNQVQADEGWPDNDVAKINGQCYQIGETTADPGARPIVNLTDPLLPSCAICEDGPPPPEGACCDPDDACFDTTAEGCVNLQGDYAGDGTACVDTDCPIETDPMGACCDHLGSGIPPECVQRTESQCDFLGGLYLGDGTSCLENNCCEIEGGQQLANCGAGGPCDMHFVLAECAPIGLYAVNASVNGGDPIGCVGNLSQSQWISAGSCGLAPLSIFGGDTCDDPLHGTYGPPCDTDFIFAGCTLRAWLDCVDGVQFGLTGAYWRLHVRFGFFIFDPGGLSKNITSTQDYLRPRLTCEVRPPLGVYPLIASNAFVQPPVGGWSIHSHTPPSHALIT